jgi:cytochrome c oxidase subunit 2
VTSLAPLGDPSSYGNFLAPSGAAAQLVAQHGWWLIGSCALVEIATLALFFVALLGGRTRAADPPSARVGCLRRPAVWIAVGVTATVLILSGFIAASFLTDRALAQMEGAPPYTHIEIIAHQWWWEIRYAAWEGGAGFVTANELHLPAGKSVSLQLSSPDVIHSLWIPAIDRKRDIIPGREQSVQLMAPQSGVFRGRCAEFCGYQHAHMDVLAIAEPAEQFDRWRAQQARAAQPPAGEAQSRGARLFSEGVCGTCHVVRGSDAPGYSATAPDLTHLATRLTLASGLLANDTGNLTAWISDPQHFKPGAKMTVNQMEPQDLQALVAYLESLQ